MNKHLQTLVGFKNGTKKIAKDCFYDLWDAWDELFSAFKKIGFVVFAFAVWLFSLVLICILPLATWLRLKWEREANEAREKAKKELMERMGSVKRGDND